MYISNDFDQRQWELLMRISSPLFLISKKNNEYLFNDEIILKYFPVIEGTPFSGDKAISKELAKSISWSLSTNDKKLLHNYDSICFIEHAKFLLSEHYKTMIEYSSSQEMKEFSLKILQKLEKQMMLNNNLDRFLKAQEVLYDQAIREIKEGKLNFECWIRYVYPQLKRSGTSKLTDFYALKDREEAKSYIKHPILRNRLVEATQVLLNNEKSIYEIFSHLGVLKVRSCILLFASVSDIPVFKQLKEKYMW